MTAPLQQLLLPITLPPSLLTTDALGSQLHRRILGLWHLAFWPSLSACGVSLGSQIWGCSHPIFLHPWALCSCFFLQPSF